MPTSPAAPCLRDPRIDAYIAAAAPFARPVLEHIRAAMHAACPDIDEAIKWNMPFFLVDGKPFANMAAFKAHCGLGFWKGGRPLAAAAAAASGGPLEQAMGQFGQVESLADLPGAAALRQLIVAARKGFVEARAAAAAAPPVPKPRRAAPEVPADLAAALAAQKPARDHFDGFTPSQQFEYVAWIEDAKREATRAARIAQAVEWIAEGKTRNWKYQAC